MNKLNSNHIWLSEKKKTIGDLYATMQSVPVGDNMQPIIYYKKGVSEIDNLFDNYIKEGYNSEIFFHEKAIILYFNKYTLKNITDQGLFFIKRKSIISVKEFEQTNLEFIQYEKLKHFAKAVGRRAFGALGAIAGLITENVKTEVKTFYGNGLIFEIEYLDDNSEIKKIQYYCNPEVVQLIGPFIKEYMVNDLPNRLKIPIQPNFY